MRKAGWYNFKTWGDVFRYHRAKGEDLGYCAWMADCWERRKKIQIPTPETNQGEEEK